MNICFLSRPSREFSGKTLEQEGLGGTQTALIYLAQNLAKLGHNVNIFCNCKNSSGEYNGVYYRNVPELIPYSKQNSIDYFVSVADENALKLGIKAKKTLWWSHNDYSHLWNNNLPDLLVDIANTLAMKADKLLVVSKWHLETLASLFNIPTEHFYIFRNGVNTSLFQRTDIKKEGLRLIYTSVPDRGLDILLKIFPLIRAQIPEVELHVFSSFKVWGKNEGIFKELEEQILQNIPEGVFVHEPVSNQKLAEEFLKSTLFVYPNHSSPQTNFFAETSCISALEAQAAGLPVITSNRGGLSETVIHNETGILIDGDPYSKEYQDRLIKETVSLLKDKDRLTQMGIKAKSRIFREYSWEIIAKEWDNKLEEWLKETKSTKLLAPPLSTKFKTPEVTVIIPTYNRARNLKNTLNALTYQTYEAFEVIVCDDGSTDNTKEIVQSFKDKLNIRYFYQEHKGFRAGHARNLGLKYARGKLIIFLDSDIIVPPEFIQTHVDTHKQPGNYVVNSYVWRMTEDREEDLGLLPKEYISKHKDILKPDSRDRYQTFERGEVEETYFLDSNALSIKAKDINIIGGFDEEFVGWGHEDTELGYRLGYKGYKLKFIKEGAEAYHQYHNFSPTKEEERAKNWERLRKKYKIDKWYKPLWELEVIGDVNINIIGDTKLNDTSKLEGEFIIKVGDKLKFNNNLLQITVINDIVKQISKI